MATHKKSDKTDNLKSARYLKKDQGAKVIKIGNYNNKTTDINLSITKIKAAQQKTLECYELDWNVWNAFKQDIKKIKWLLLNMHLFLERVCSLQDQALINEAELREDWQALHQELMAQDIFLVNLCLLGSNLEFNLSGENNAGYKDKDYLAAIKNIDFMQLKQMKTLSRSLSKAFFYCKKLTGWLAENKLNPILFSLSSSKVTEQNIKAFEISNINYLRLEQQKFWLQLLEQKRLKLQNQTKAKTPIILTSH